jgi:hypothetical protein
LEAAYGTALSWSVIDTSTPEGVQRLRDVRRAVGRRVPVPAILIAGSIGFEGIPEEEELAAALAAAMGR